MHKTKDMKSELVILPHLDNVTVDALAGLVKSLAGATKYRKALLKFRAQYLFYKDRGVIKLSQRNTESLIVALSMLDRLNQEHGNKDFQIVGGLITTTVEALMRHQNMD